VLYGFLGDWVGAYGATVATALVALSIFPLAFALAPHLADIEGNERNQLDNSRQRPGAAIT
jgi:hypothetical protein